MYFVIQNVFNPQKIKAFDKTQPPPAKPLIHTAICFFIVMVITFVIITLYYTTWLLNALINLIG